MAAEPGGGKGPAGSVAGSGAVASGLKVALISAGAAIVGAALTFAGVYATGWFGRQTKDDELKVELVKIGAGILSVKKRETDVQPRNGAVELMEINSGLPMLEAEKKKLVADGGLQGVPIATGGPAKCAPTANGRYLKFSFDPATGTYPRAEVVDASQCQ